MSQHSLRPIRALTPIWSGRADLEELVPAAAGHAVPAVLAGLADVVDLDTRRSAR